MKFLYIFLFSIIVLASCRKEDSIPNDRGFFKTISTEIEMSAVSCFQTMDNNYMIVGRSLKNDVPGWIVKVDKKGEEIWRKRIPEANRVLWNAVPLSGGGFMTVGYEVISVLRFNYVKYDEEGNEIDADTISIPRACNGSTPADVIQLTNGNFVFAMGTAGSIGYIVVTDNSMNLLYTQLYENPDSGYNGCSFNGLRQINDSTLALTASSNKNIGSTSAYTNSFLITTDLNGFFRSRTFLEDSLESQTCNFVGSNSNGILSVTSSMIGWNIGQGVYVNYLANSIAQYISGRINLVKYAPDGSYINRNKVLSYPGNGMINKGNPTRDGGYILCGTVNQSNVVTVDANTQLYLLKLDANFNVQWSKAFNTIYPSFGIDAFETSDGDFIVTGHQNILNKFFNMIVIKTDAKGNI